MGTRTLTRDLPCIYCSYNLRALPIDQACPECGRPISRTWKAAQEGSYIQFQRTAHEIVRDWLSDIARAASTPVDGLFFVWDAINFLGASHRTGLDLGDPAERHATAADVCLSVREYANIYFNDPREA